MSFKRLSLALAGILAVALTQQVSAQAVCAGSNPCSVTNNVKVTVPTLLKLTLSSATTDLAAATEAAFDAGSQVDLGPTATVKANRAWSLTIAAGADFWTGAAGGRADKPAGDLQWRALPAGSFASLSTTAAPVLSAQPATGGATTGFEYKTLWSWTADIPGDYSLDVVYTLTAP